MQFGTCVIETLNVQGSQKSLKEWQQIIRNSMISNQTAYKLIRMLNPFPNKKMSLIKIDGGSYGEIFKDETDEIIIKRSKRRSKGRSKGRQGPAFAREMIMHILLYCGGQFITDRRNAPNTNPQAPVEFENPIPHIRHVYRNPLSLVMDIIHGKSLNTWIKQSDRKTDEIFDVLLQIYTQLAWLIEGLGFIHGDLHGGNIIVSKRAKAVNREYTLPQKPNFHVVHRSIYRAYIIDFGNSCMKIPATIPGKIITINTHEIYEYNGKSKRCNVSGFDAALITTFIRDKTKKMSLTRGLKSFLEAYSPREVKSWSDMYSYASNINMFKPYTAIRLAEALQSKVFHELEEEPIDLKELLSSEYHPVAVKEENLNKMIKIFHKINNEILSKRIKSEYARWHIIQAHLSRSNPLSLDVAIDTYLKAVSSVKKIYRQSKDNHYLTFGSNSLKEHAGFEALSFCVDVAHFILYGKGMWERLELDRLRKYSDRPESIKDIDKRTCPFGGGSNFIIALATTSSCICVGYTSYIVAMAQEFGYGDYVTSCSINKHVFPIIHQKETITLPNTAKDMSPLTYKIIAKVEIGYKNNYVVDLVFNEDQVPRVYKDMWYENRSNQLFVSDRILEPCTQLNVNNFYNNLHEFYNYSKERDHVRLLFDLSLAGVILNIPDELTKRYGLIMHNRQLMLGFNGELDSEKLNHFNKLMHSLILKFSELVGKPSSGDDNFKTLIFLP